MKGKLQGVRDEAPRSECVLQDPGKTRGSSKRAGRKPPRLEMRFWRDYQDAIAGRTHAFQGNLRSLLKKVK
jgi:hypothetical protein